jgi:hypothetical protein
VDSARWMLAAAGIGVAVELHATPGPAVESPLAIVSARGRHQRRAATPALRPARSRPDRFRAASDFRVANNGVPPGTPDRSDGQRGGGSRAGQSPGAVPARPAAN